MRPSAVPLCLALLPATVSPARARVKPLTFRTSAQREVAPAREIVDGQWIIIGNSPKAGGHVLRDTDHPYKGGPVYRFRADDGRVNRIEFSEVFGSAENLKGLSKKRVADLLALKDAYARAEVGRYGDTMTYEWATRFPEKLTADSRAIFAQWHGRPERTLIDDGKALRRWSVAEFLELARTVEFRDGGWGYDKASGKKTRYRVDGAAGGPIGAFKIGQGYMYLLVRSDASRQSNSDVKLKPKPTQPIGHRIHKGNKEASLVWKLPLADVPINEWITFKVRIHYSEYDPNADRVIAAGSVDVWMNGRQVAAWKGNVGKNDALGPYFKWGIYKPGAGGFRVDHAAYRRTIRRTRKSPARRAPQP